MSKRFGSRCVRFAMRVAFWPPVLFCGMRGTAQTSGLPAPVSGDCSLNGSGGVVCTKSNGVGLSPSATTDTTNAGNISSGVLSTARGGTGGGTVAGLRKANGAGADTAASAGADFQGPSHLGAIGYEAIGDSITKGTGVADLANGYVAIVSRYVGGNLLNYGVPGYQSEDVAYRVAFPNQNPGPAHNPFRTYFALHNDLHWCSTGQGGTSGNTPGCLANANSAMLATFTWLTLPITSKQMGVNATSLTGTWANDATLKNTAGAAVTLGTVSSTSGSTATFTVTTTAANQPVYLWYKGADGDGGAATLSIDGAPVDTLLTASTSGQCFCTMAGSTTTVQGKRYVVAATGAHALVVGVTSATSASNTVTIYGVGTPAQNANLVIAPPSLGVLAPVYENAMNLSAATDAYAATESALVTLLAGDGLPVNYTDTRRFMTVATDMSGSTVAVPNGTGDNWSGTACSAVSAGNAGQHPNVCGNMHIAQAVLSGNPVSAISPFPGVVTMLDDLRSAAPAANTATAIIGGLDLYTAGRLSPGYSFGTAVGTLTNLPSNGLAAGNGLFVAHYTPNNAAGTYFGCSFAPGRAVTFAGGFLNAANGFDSCVMKVTANPGTESGAAIQFLKGDQYGQMFSVAGLPAAGYQYTNEAATGTNYTSGLYYHYSAANAIDFMGLFVSPGTSAGTNYALRINTGAPTGSQVIDGAGNTTMLGVKGRWRHRPVRVQWAGFGSFRRMAMRAFVMGLLGR